VDRVTRNSPLRIILAILACYRLSLLVSEDDGPADVFRKLRKWTDEKRLSEQANGVARGKWANIDDGVRCPYCVGVWVSSCFVGRVEESALPRSEDAPVIRTFIILLMIG